jgi:hypothetical protein
MVILFSGWPSIYLLVARDSLTTKDQLKSPGRLAADVVGAYSGVSTSLPHHDIDKDPNALLITPAHHLLLSFLWIQIHQRDEHSPVSRL